LLYGGLETWRHLQVKDNIRKLLYMDGIHSPFNVRAIVHSDTIELKTEGFTKTQADSISKALSAELFTTEPFSFRLLDGNIAFIEFNSMSNRFAPLWYASLRRYFTEIRDKRVKGVIIDLRKNGGGNSQLGDSLLSYISAKPYRGSAGVRMRISRHSKAFARLTGNEDPFANWKNGKLYEYKVKQLTIPPANPLRFDGRVAVLIGTGTFSSANMLTNAIKDFQLATLVGQATAEPGNDFGEIIPSMLPNTHIVASTAVKMFTRANGDDKDFNGIQPDIEVKSRRHPEAKKDAVLEQAVEWILK
jgi:C-terminal processing protease CtpA/Prc